MHSLRIVTIITLAATALLVVGKQANTAKAPSTGPRDQLIKSARKQTARTDYHLRQQVSFPPAKVSRPQTTAPSRTASANFPPPPSPGVAVGTTWLDIQSTHSLGKQIAREPGTNYVHMVWSSIQNFDSFGEWDQVEVIYNSYRISTGSLFPGLGGEPMSIGTSAVGQYGNVDVEDAGAAHVILAQREDVSFPRAPWADYLPLPGNTLHFDDALIPSGACGEALWPKIAIQQRAGSDDVRHVVARSGFNCDDERLFYWRFADALWSGPALIDSTFAPSYVLAADNNSNKVAIIFHDIDEPSFNGANNVCYYESITTGLGWQSGAELGPSFKRIITNYTDTLNGPQSWQHIDATYDNTGRLHVIWDEQISPSYGPQGAIRHWNSVRNIIRPVALGYYPNPYMNLRLNLTGLSIGIGDGATTCAAGTNFDVVYVTYTKFGGTSAAEQADVAGIPGSQTHPNGELCLSTSSSGGNTWASPRNLTNTKTPNCRPQIADSVCRSEDWATLNKVVSDLDILYISDRDAGAAPQGIGTYQPNDVMYLRIPGGGVNTDIVCPTINPGYEATITAEAECEYHAEPGTVKNDELLYVFNLGNALLFGTISVLPGAPWLTIPGSGPYTISPGGADLIYTLVMDATSLTEGMYTATIRISHNDPDKPSPLDYPIEFYVIEDFNCPQGSVISTGVE